MSEGLEFFYLKKSNRYYPVADITLQRNKAKITLKALIDSGATYSIFRPEVADYLGIGIEKGKLFYLEGIGGRILGYLHKIRLNVGNKSYNIKIVFSREFTVSFNILGRDNFFVPFHITFCESDKKVIISEKIQL